MHDLTNAAEDSPEPLPSTGRVLYLDQAHKLEPQRIIRSTCYLEKLAALSAEGQKRCCFRNAAASAAARLAISIFPTAVSTAARESSGIISPPVRSCSYSAISSSTAAAAIARVPVERANLPMAIPVGYRADGATESPPGSANSSPRNLPVRSTGWLGSRSTAASRCSLSGSTTRRCISTPPRPMAGC